MDNDTWPILDCRKSQKTFFVYCLLNKSVQNMLKVGHVKISASGNKLFTQRIGSLTGSLAMVPQCLVFVRRFCFHNLKKWYAMAKETSAIFFNPKVSTVRT